VLCACTTEFLEGEALQITRLKTPKGPCLRACALYTLPFAQEEHRYPSISAKQRKFAPFPREFPGFLMMKQQSTRNRGMLAEDGSTVQMKSSEQELTICAA
jgi:hypothetical protein